MLVRRYADSQAPHSAGPFCKDEVWIRVLKSAKGIIRTKRYYWNDLNISDRGVQTSCFCQVLADLDGLILKKKIYTDKIALRKGGGYKK